MRQPTKSPGEKIVNDIKRATRKQYSSEEKIAIVLDGLRGEDSVAEPSAPDCGWPFSCRTHASGSSLSPPCSGSWTA